MENINTVNLSLDVYNELRDFMNTIKGENGLVVSDGYRGTTYWTNDDAIKSLTKLIEAHITDYTKLEDDYDVIVREVTELKSKKGFWSFLKKNK